MRVALRGADREAGRVGDLCEADVERILTDHHLKGKLEAVKDGYWFYNPDGGDYRTKSKPK